MTIYEIYRSKKRIQYRSSSGWSQDTLPERNPSKQLDPYRSKSPLTTLTEAAKPSMS